MLDPFVHQSSLTIDISAFDDSCCWQEDETRGYSTGTAPRGVCLCVTSLALAWLWIEIPAVFAETRAISCEGNTSSGPTCRCAVACREVLCSSLPCVSVESSVTLRRSDDNVECCSKCSEAA